MRGMTRLTNLAYSISQWTDRKVEDYHFDDIHQRTADRVYEVICAQDPGRRPDGSVLRRIDAYATEVLGSPRFAPWLRVYTAWAGEFREGWIPDNYFGRVVLPAVQGPARTLSSFRTLARRLIAQEDLLPDQLYRVRGQWLDLDGRPLDPAEVEEVAFEHGPRVVVKNDASTQGRGVRVVERGRDDLLRLEGDFVVQRWITQPEWMARFNAESLATIRIMTLKPTGEPAAWCGGNLRFGVTGSEVLKSAEAIRIAMMDSQGTLDECGALPDWTRVTRHPQSGLEWKGLEVPGFPEVRDTCARLHDALPHLTLIGWDVALDREGTYHVLEWNSIHPGIVYIEANTGPQFVGLGWEELWKR